MRFLTALAAMALLATPLSALAQEADSTDPRLAPMDAHYDRISQAYAESDPGMVLAYRTTDFYVELQGGARIDYDNSMRILLEFFEQSESAIEARTEVQCARMLNDAEASFIVTQHTLRTMSYEGRSRRVQSAVTQTESWRLTPEGWRLASVSNIHGLRRWVDGREIDPSRAWEENGRAFTPAATPPVMCEAGPGSAAP
jgi:hypothetical protein